jgi:hypothetical protein
MPRLTQLNRQGSVEVSLCISEVDATFDDVGALKSVSRVVSSYTLSTYPVPRLHTWSLIERKTDKRVLLVRICQALAHLAYALQCEAV